MSGQISVEECLPVSVQVVSVFRVSVFNRTVESDNVFRETREQVRTVPLSEQFIHRFTEPFVLFYQLVLVIVRVVSYVLLHEFYVI